MKKAIRDQFVGNKRNSCGPQAFGLTPTSSAYRAARNRAWPPLVRAGALSGLLFAGAARYSRKGCRPCALPEIFGDIGRDNNCGPQTCEIEPSDLGCRAHRYWSDHPRQARADDGAGSEDEKYRGAIVSEPQTTGTVAQQTRACANEG